MKRWCRLPTDSGRWSRASAGRAPSRRTIVLANCRRSRSCGFARSSARMQTWRRPARARTPRLGRAFRQGKRRRMVIWTFYNLFSFIPDRARQVRVQPSEMRKRPATIGAFVVVAVGILAATVSGSTGARPYRVDPAIHKIQHVVVIMQENRSLRLLLRDVSGRRRDPDARRRPDGLRPRSDDGRVRAAVPRHERRQRRRPARRGERDRPTSTAARWTASSPQARTARRRAASTRRTRTARNGADADVMGYHDRARDPELLGVRAELRAAGPHVRAERVVEPARASVHGLGVVGEVLDHGRSR